MVGPHAVDGRVQFSIEDSLEELAALAETAGIEVIGGTFQRLERIQPASYIGKGKVGELKEEKDYSDDEESETDLGMTVEEITPQMARNFGLSETSGLIIVRVQRDSPAAEAGLQQGDIILEVDQDELSSLSAFYKKIRKYKEGDTVLFLIKRAESTIYLTLKIED